MRIYKRVFRDGKCVIESLGSNFHSDTPMKEVLEELESVPIVVSLMESIRRGE